MAKGDGGAAYLTVLQCVTHYNTKPNFCQDLVMDERALKRVAVFIDGTNARCRLEECKWPEDVDILYLAQKLAGPRNLVGTYYYTSNPNREHLGEALYASRRHYLALVQRSGVNVKRGYMANRDGHWQEKMVDVLIASDMLYFAARKTYDVAILVTADNDLVPAIQRAKNLGRKVELLIFTQAKAEIGDLLKACSIHRKARVSHFRLIE